MISTAQIGAPKLLSASAEITGIELERTETDFSRQSSSQRSKGISKGTFKLRLKEKGLQNRPPSKYLVQGWRAIEYESPVSPTRAYEQDTNRGSSKWLAVQGADPYESRSDYASSILDLYGCDSHSPRPISNRSSVSRYSTNFEPSRPASPTSTPGLSQPIEPTTSATSTTGSDRLSSPRPPHNLTKRTHGPRSSTSELD
ncbi:hypothetical protein H4Q26_003339 [Puccinia striiformis f. sp. tritici PST-130]|nr:hypothetical protein H4Q26_003339 [Puccinia striiformis f. sp. tritici PST-130]